MKPLKRPAKESADNAPAGRGVFFSGDLRPYWDTLRRELTVDGQVVKRFWLPAANREAILLAFEEEDWPAAVLDPSPPRGEKNCRQRLHDTIKQLNRSRLARVIFFRGDGTGEGVLWEWSRDRRPPAMPPRANLGRALCLAHTAYCYIELRRHRSKWVSGTSHSP